MFNTPEEVFYSVIAGVILMIFVSIIFILSIVRYQTRLHRHQQEKQKLNEEFAQTLLQSQLEIQEQTLQHISRELHDNLGQVASLIKINLNVLQLQDPINAAEKIEDTKELTKQLIADIKSLSVSLGNDRIAKSGLEGAIKTEVERLNKTGYFEVTYLLKGDMPFIANDKAVILYRMVQEVLNNIVKHSDAKHISLLLTVKENLFILAIGDDGVGFDIAEKLKSGGAGLTNLQNRAALIKSRLSVNSIIGKGTEIIIEQPL